VWRSPPPPLLPSLRLLARLGPSTTNSHPFQTRDQLNRKNHAMLQLLNLSALRNKSKSHPQLSCIAEKRKGQAAKAVARDQGRSRS